MSEDLYFSDPDKEPDENEDDQKQDEVDPSVVAFLDQEQAAYDEGAAERRMLYGFDHQCTCAQDYSESKLTEVTECFVRLTGEALARCAEATHETKLLSAMIDRLLAMNNDLVKMLEDAGKSKELEDYFSLDADEIEHAIFDEGDLEGLPEDLPGDELDDGDDDDDGVVGVA